MPHFHTTFVAYIKNVLGINKKCITRGTNLAYINSTQAASHLLAGLQAGAVLHLID